MGDVVGLIERYTDDRPIWPGDARLHHYDVSGWALVASDLVFDRTTEAVAQDSRLLREAVEAGVAFCRQYQGAIDSRLAPHDAAFA